MKVADREFRVESNIEVAPGIRHMKLAASDGKAVEALPGQFAMIRAARADDPLLRRPLSYLGADGEGIEFLYRVVGRGTELLSQKINGETIDILGPLGRPFDTGAVRSNALLVAGGMGVAPLYFLAGRLAARGVEVNFVYGACNAGELFRLESLRECCASVGVATDDGSAGEQCFASDLGAKLFEAAPPDIVFACGPHPMIEAMASAAKSRGAPCQVSLEARMACGVGACLGCSISTRTGMVRVCKDGPVFDSGEIFP